MMISLADGKVQTSIVVGRLRDASGVMIRAVGGFPAVVADPGVPV